MKINEKILIEGLTTPNSRPVEWLWGGSGGKKHPDTTDPAAQAVVDAWEPGKGRHVQPMKPGWAGLASYKVVEQGGADHHLKVAIVPEDENARGKYAALCADAATEAQRARWAGERNLGPQVKHVNAKLGGFITSFAVGTLPTMDALQGPLLSAYVHKLGALHSQSTAALPPPGPRNWYFDHNTQEHFSERAKNTTPRPSSVQSAIEQVERGLDAFFERKAGTFPQVPVHDDMHPGNTLVNGREITVLDWNNLKAADGAIDLGHFNLMADISMADVKRVMAMYRASLATDAAPRSDNDLSLRAQAYTAYFRLRGMTFAGQWPGETSDYLLHQLKNDVAVLRDSVLREVGLRPSDALQEA